MTYRKKLIEVSLPLEAINKESAREKSIRHGHPSTLHLWWARRPLAACRAVLFASLVDDPSSHLDRFPTEEAQNVERQRIFDILGRIETIEETGKNKGKTKQVVRGLVSWDDINNPSSGVLEAAQREIARSIAWNRGDEPPTEPEAVRQYLAEFAPPVYDPFCGGGSIPLEAQRLGLEAHGSDLNPVAVLITKALIEIPPKFKDLPPVNSEARKKRDISEWQGAQGLAEDVRYYGKWMRDEAEKRIGHIYPKVALPPEQGDGEATVIAWLWARTVKCPNPACGCEMPLVRSFALSTKKGKETWVESTIDRALAVPVVRFGVKSGEGEPLEGTVSRKGAVCLACRTPVPLDYVRAEGKAGRMGARMMAIVAEGKGNRIYLPPNEEHEEIAASAKPEWKPETDLPKNSRDFKTPNYGMKTLATLFTTRQLITLNTISILVDEARNQLLKDGASEFHAEAVAIYLGLALSKLSDALTTLVRWKSSMDQAIATFGRQAIPMVWDYAESNPFNGAAGDYSTTIETIVRVIKNLNPNGSSYVKQIDATAITSFTNKPMFSTDPPYYDNIAYADLSDFFYVWLRRSLGSIYPEVFGTLLVPKSQELVASAYRFDGSKKKAKDFFEESLEKVFSRIDEVSHPDYPITVYYAFKQAETEKDDDEDSKVSFVSASTGWETMLEGLIKAGFSITGTMPLRTELSNRTIASGSNALASSIVLVCRPRPDSAPSTTRRQFLISLQRELPDALKKLQQGNIAPVDLAQASIGPGMAIYSRYTKVLEADGTPLRVRTALQLINQTLDEFLTEQEGEFDSDTRWAIAWFEQHQFAEGLYGIAETLSKAKNTSVAGLETAGILQAQKGKVRLLRREEIKQGSSKIKTISKPLEMNMGSIPAINLFSIDLSSIPPIDLNSLTPLETSHNTLPHLNQWFTTQLLIETLNQDGETGAAQLLSQLGSQGETTRDLAYRLYNICERKNWSQEAIAYNSLVISWSEITRLAAELQSSQPRQTQLPL